jgi:hypothetical protein
MIMTATPAKRGTIPGEGGDASAEAHGVTKQPTVLFDLAHDSYPVGTMDMRGCNEFR